MLLGLLVEEAHAHGLGQHIGEGDLTAVQDDLLTRSQQRKAAAGGGGGALAPASVGHGRLHAAAVDGGALGNGEVELRVLQRPGEAGGQALGDLGHAGGPADQEDLVDIQPGNLARGGVQGPLDDVERLVEKVAGRRLELLLGHEDHGLHALVAAAQARLLLLAQGLLGGLDVVHEALIELRVGGRVVIDAALLHEFGQDEIEEGLVPIRPAQLAVAVGGDDLECVLRDAQHGAVEGAAAQVVDEVALVLRGGDAHRQGRGDRLGQDSDHVEPGDLARLPGGLLLPQAEVGGDGDDDLAAGRARRLLRLGHQLLEDERGDGLRVEGLVEEDALVLLPHLPLDEGDGLIGVDPRAVLRLLADDEIGCALEVDDGGCGVLAIAVLDDLRPTVLVHMRNGRVGGPQVDSEDVLAHMLSSSQVSWISSAAHPVGAACGRAPPPPRGRGRRVPGHRHL